MQALMANLVTENRFYWFFPVAIALIGVFVAEVFCIVFLIRKMVSAKKEGSKDQNGGTGVSSMALLLVTESVIRSREIWLLALAILALAGAFVLTVLLIVCYANGFLFTRKEKEVQKKINVLGFLKENTAKEEPAKPEEEVDFNSAMSAFGAEEEELSNQPAIQAAAYTPSLYSKYDDPEDDEIDEDAEDDLSLVDDDDIEEEAELADPSDDPDLFTGNERIVGYDAESDCNVVERYRKSFEAKLIQSEPQIKRYYSALKNALLSYKGTKSRLSWTADSFHNGRMQIAKINVKTRILELYLALDPASLEGTVYRGQDVGALRKYEETPFRYKIRTPRKFNWALELVQRVCEEHGLSPIDIEPVDYESQYPFDTIEHLIQRKLVKVSTRLEKAPGTFELDDGTQPGIAPAPYMPEKEEDAGKSYQAGGVEAEPGTSYFDPFADEVEEAPAERDVPAVAEQEEEEEAKPTWGDQISLVDQQTELFEDQQAGAEVAPADKRVDPDMAQVDIALLDLHFRDGDTVDLNVLKRRGLVFSDAARLKVRATGKMSRRLTIIANQFTYNALLAINEAGGTAQFIR